MAAAVERQAQEQLHWVGPPLRDRRSYSSALGESFIWQPAYPLPGNELSGKWTRVRSACFKSGLKALALS